MTYSVCPPATRGADWACKYVHYKAPKKKIVGRSSIGRCFARRNPGPFSLSDVSCSRNGEGVVLAIGPCRPGGFSFFSSVADRNLHAVVITTFWVGNDHMIIAYVGQDISVVFFL